METKVTAKRFVPSMAQLNAGLKDEEKDAKGVEPVSHRVVMSALKAASPIIQATIIAPGSHADPALRAGAISGMVKQAYLSASDLMETLAPDLASKGWARSEAFEFCAKIVSSEWIASQEIDFSSNPHPLSLNKDLFMQLQKNVLGADDAAHKWMEKIGSYPAITSHSDAATRIRMSLMKSATPMVIEINRFAFWQNLSKRDIFVGEMVDAVSEFAARHANTLSDQFAMLPADRISLWQGDLNRAFTFATEEYRRIAQVADNESDAAPDESSSTKVKSGWYKKAVSGDLTRDILSRVESNFKILDGIADRISHSIVASENPEAAPTEGHGEKPNA